LLEMAERSSGTLLLNRSIGVEAARTLLDMADIYASPHASEGFGLTIAEAMAMGKPVVASNFGGSTDFLDESCGFPVPCTPWQLQEDDGAYPRGTTWGRIDEDRLAATLVTVASLSAPDLAELGVKARQRIEEQLSPRAVANRMRAAIDDVLAC
jgi:glycosyltransferase involved in cell wall biosynthesis